MSRWSLKQRGCFEVLLTADRFARAKLSSPQQERELFIRETGPERLCARDVRCREKLESGQNLY